MKGITESIRKKISTLPKGQIFSFDDFVDFGSYDTVKKVLYRLEKSGNISRVFDGLYTNPKISKLTGDRVPINLEDIATYIAQKNLWTIVPSGLWCLNFLGLSTQLPGTFEYVSDGPYRTYNIRGTTLTFKHTAPAEVRNMSVRSQQVVQAIKTLGKDNISKKDIIKLRNTLPNEDKEKLKTECKRVTKWVYSYIKEIAEN